MLCVWTLPYGCRFEPERQQIPRVEMQEDLGDRTCLDLYVAVIIGFYNDWIRNVSFVMCFTYFV